jgi:hypothetical protein
MGRMQVRGKFRLKLRKSSCCLDDGSKSGGSTALQQKVYVVDQLQRTSFVNNVLVPS